MPRTPEASQGTRKSGFYLTCYADWRSPEYKDKPFDVGREYLDRVFAERYQALPSWIKEIIGEPNIGYWKAKSWAWARRQAEVNS